MAPPVDTHMHAADTAKACRNARWHHQWQVNTRPSATCRRLNAISPMAFPTPRREVTNVERLIVDRVCVLPDEPSPAIARRSRHALSNFGDGKFYGLYARRRNNHTAAAYLSSKACGTGDAKTGERCAVSGRQRNNVCSEIVGSTYR